ncbi:MAG: MOSC domain-containing protein [Amaricoccus sp.]|uniref:MOSC domain-containing protein n=1 Tax=Amaricoccus sp. TaxID=1872485 RepID=UPI0039E4F2A3
MRLASIWRHPIKAHGAEPLQAVTLQTGRTMPWDRVWAIADSRAKVEPGSADWAPCVNFSRGAKSPRLMAIRARVDEARGRVHLSQPDVPDLDVNPDDPDDARALVAWAAALAAPERPAPAFVVRAGQGMTDSNYPTLSLLNRASLAALGDQVGKPLAEARFRGNLWLEGLAPFAEFDLVGRDLRVGAARVRVTERITRCKATMVDPETGLADADTLGALRAGWGHQDFGVYVTVTDGGRVAVGDGVTLLD